MKLPKLGDVVFKCGHEKPVFFTLSLLQACFSFNCGAIYVPPKVTIGRMIPQARQFLKLSSIKLNAEMNTTFIDATLEELGRGLKQLNNLNKVHFNFLRSISFFALENLEPT